MKKILIAAVLGLALLTGCSKESWDSSMSGYHEGESTIITPQKTYHTSKYYFKVNTGYFPQVIFIDKETDKEIIVVGNFSIEKSK